MKKYLIKSISLFLIALAFSSCDAIIDQEEIDFGKGPVLTTFTKTENGFWVS